LIPDYEKKILRYVWLTLYLDGRVPSEMRCVVNHTRAATKLNEIRRVNSCVYSRRLQRLRRPAGLRSAARRPIRRWSFYDGGCCGGEAASTGYPHSAGCRDAVRLSGVNEFTTTCLLGARRRAATDRQTVDTGPVLWYCGWCVHLSQFPARKPSDRTENLLMALYNAAFRDSRKCKKKCDFTQICPKIRQYLRRSPTLGASCCDPRFYRV